MTGPTSEPSEGTPGARHGARFTAVITRPAGQSASLLVRLAEEGIDALEFPLIAIGPAEDEAPLREAFASLDRYALVVFVSPNAVDHAFARYGAIWPHALPIGVVGPGSVAALARHGVAAPAYRVISPAQASSDDDAARFDSEALFAAIETTLGERALEGKRVLIVRGDGGREWLAERLRQAGAEVQPVAAYRRIVPEPSIAAWDRVHALLAGKPHAWLVTSSEGVRNLDELAREHLTAGELAALRRAPLVTPHPRIAETARGLGFDSITVSGAGDERIVRALRAAVPAAAHPAAEPAVHPDVKPVTTNPAHSRMTDSNDSNNTSSQRGATAPVQPGSPSAPPVNAPFTPYEAQKPRRGASGPLLWFVVVVIACAAGVGGFALNRKVARMDERLVQRQQANDAQTAELRVKTDQAVATVHQMDSQVAQLEGKLADAQNAQQALAQQYADLARNRDDWTLAEVGQMLSSASEQLQLTGNTQLALFALQSADQRLAASDGAQALAVRKAIAQDIDKLKAAPSTDLTGLGIKLDNAIDAVDSLPLAGEAPVAHAKPQAPKPADTAKLAAATGEPRWKVWLQSFATGIGHQLTSLVQVRRIDNADAMLVAPDQGYFVRQNVKLRLLSARISLLSRNQAALKSDLHAADAALARYFDNASKQTQTVRDLVKQVDAGSPAVELPNLNTSLQAVRQYRSRG
ncbi:fused uroporphyrinogen-III synthase HemD/membrane protein HemX [Paraburkholderia sp. SUR17]|uniref:fused uroporphyrinogen-III synthase HemD/membrane protein HemX n=1 Tax=Paraburkholderia sp. SUR17 TaxID=3034358 RepID=UPI002407E71B|nr:fused uroporphyrinogen-III synthase HemD/membrane protein HemX [Paraburkholderia sp. SUR17]WEY39558.1 fused uroporphyrinogen-III synthase HemD/membrane protein HemX [Paraburkholderia sp. SUR17]